MALPTSSIRRSNSAAFPPACPADPCRGGRLRRAGALPDAHDLFQQHVGKAVDPAAEFRHIAGLDPEIE